MCSCLGVRRENVCWIEIQNCYTAISTGGQGHTQARETRIYWLGFASKRLHWMRSEKYKPVRLEKWKKMSFLNSPFNTQRNLQRFSQNSWERCPFKSYCLPMDQWISVWPRNRFWSPKVGKAKISNRRGNRWICEEYGHERQASKNKTYSRYTKDISGPCLDNNLQVFKNEKGCCQMGPEAFNRGPWVHHFDPESKRQSMEWKHPSSPTPKKPKMAESAG